MDARREAFILRHTRLQRPPHVPEIQLHLADEMMPLWESIEEELGEREGAPPFWAFAWAGGLALTRYLLDDFDVVRERRVLDFATGSGLCAIGAVKSGAAHALAADTDVFAEEAVALNALVNGVEVAFTGRDLLLADPPEVDVILAGDICYEEPLAARVIAWLREAQARGTHVLIGDPFRAHLPGGLVQLAEYKVPTTRDLEDAEVKRAGVFTFPR